MPDRRFFRRIQSIMLLAIGLLAACTSLPGGVSEADPATGAAAQPIMTVYKSPTCGCCEEWAKIMAEQGFSVRTENVADINQVKAEHTVAPALQSCHTAIVDGYVIEGHVPAADIHRLLDERPNVLGLAVPGMPMGSPGMEIAGRAGEPFDVLTFDVSGNVRLFTQYE